ncbi:hypothetical protein AVEN_168660-1, partial [Araneus ventricosus]
MASSTGPSVVGLQVNHSATRNIQARTDDRKIYSLDLAGLYSAPHAPFDEIVSPSHRRTAPRVVANSKGKRGKHNHALNTTALLEHRDLSDDIKLKFIKLLRHYYSVESALQCHQTDLM